MSNFATSVIVTNTGAQNNLLLATERLRKRVVVIQDRIARERSTKVKATGTAGLVESERQWFSTLAELEQSHLVFVASSYKPFVSLSQQYFKSTAGAALFDNKVKFTMPIQGEFINDAVVHIRIEGLSAVDAANKVRFVEMIGNRLIREAVFKVGSIVIDSYSNEKYNIHWQYNVPHSKRVGYMRNVGQEVPVTGYLVSDPTIQTFREYRQYAYGPQTFKSSHGALDLWIPLLFWFKDTRTSLANFLITGADPTIELTFEALEKLIAVINFTETTDKIYVDPKITKCELYTNHIYLDQSIMKLYQETFSTQMIRVTLEQTIPGWKVDSGNIHMHKMKHPLEMLYMGVRPVSNKLHGTLWNRNTINTKVSPPTAVAAGGFVLQMVNAEFYMEADPLMSLNVSIDSHELYPLDIPASFHNSYTGYQRGICLNTPIDLGIHRFDFSLYPGLYQPSGYVDTSSSRELYVNFKSAIDETTSEPYIRPSNPCDIWFLGIAINFLQYGNKTLSLKYST